MSKKEPMNFIKEILAFEQWLRTNHLPPISQLLWYKIFLLCNGAGWPEWVVVENAALMAQIHLSNEASFIRYRDKLLEHGLIEYQKGKKGSPNKYKLNSVLARIYTYDLQAKNKDLQFASTNSSTNDSINGSQNGVQMAVQTAVLYKVNENENTRKTLVVDVVDDGCEKDLQFASTNSSTNDSINGSQNGVQMAVQIPSDTSQETAEASLAESLYKHQEAIKVIVKHYGKNIGGMLSGTASMEIKDFLDAGMEAAVICRAIDASVDANARNWFYARAILNSLVTEGILTVEQFKISEANREAAKARKNAKGGTNAADRGSAGHESFDPSKIDGFNRTLPKFDDDD